MLHLVGTPFTGYVALTNGTPAADIPIYVIAGAGTAYVVGATERIVLFGVLMSTNDTAVPLVQVTDKAASPKVLASAYVTSTQPNAGIALPPGVVLGRFNSAVRAVANAVTSGKTVEVTIYGLISQT